MDGPKEADSGIARFATAGKASYSRLPVERGYYNSLQPCTGAMAIYIVEPVSSWFDIRYSYNIRIRTI